MTIGVRDDQDQVAQAKNLWPGMTVIDINDQVRQQINIPRGITGRRVAEVNRPWRAAIAPIPR